MVNVFPLIFLTLLACSACDEEITYVDIVSFIQELYPDLIETKINILETNQTIPKNVWGIDAIRKLINEDSLGKIYFQGELHNNAQDCILRLTEEALDTQIFMDKEFNIRCNYIKYWDILQAHFTSLTSAEDSAKTLVNDFINANMWCSNNGDLPACYLQVHKSIIEKGVVISSLIQSAKDGLATVEDDFDNNSEECTVEAIAKTIFLENFVKETLEFCLN